VLNYIWEVREVFGQKLALLLDLKFRRACGPIAIRIAFGGFLRGISVAAGG